MLFLTAQQIRDIAAAHDIQVTNHWNAVSVGSEPPTLNRMSLVFTREAPEAFDVLMSAIKEVPIAISGTRQTALSNTMTAPGFPAGADRLTPVNAPHAEAEPAIAQ